MDWMLAQVNEGQRAILQTSTRPTPTGLPWLLQLHCPLRGHDSGHALDYFACFAFGFCPFSWLGCHGCGVGNTKRSCSVRQQHATKRSNVGARECRTQLKFQFPLCSNGNRIGTCCYEQRELADSRLLDIAMCRCHLDMSFCS
jgi:hypothetical protein